MNYALYLQNGGSAEPRQFSEEEIAMIKTLLPYGEAFKQSPGGAIEMAARELNFNLDSPAEIREFLTGLDAYARLIDDVDLINDIQKFGQESNLVAEEPMFKCGGRVRAKVKKASCGKKLEKGAKVPVEKKGGCPCQYRRVGGRIQLVDCNGIPVAKNGAVLKAQLGWKVPVDTGKPAYMYDLEAHRDPLLDGIIAYKLFQDKQKAEAAAQARAQKQKEFENTFVGGGINYGRKNPFLVVRESMTPKEQSAYNPYAELQQSLAAKRQAALTEQAKERVAAQAAASAPQTTLKNTFGTGKQGKFGGLTYDEALARQNEMLAAKAQGFNVDLGRWGADGKWGNQSRSEWERYQLWKADQELAAMKAQNAGLLRIESSAALNPTRITVDNSTATAPLAVTRNGDIVRTSSLTPGQALSQLNTPAWEEYTRRLRQGILSSKNGGKISYADYLK